MTVIGSTQPEAPTCAITLFTTLDGRPCNKILTRAADGSVQKNRAKSGRYTARTVEFSAASPMAELAELMRSVGTRPDQMISLSLFDDPPADEWQVWPSWELAEALDCTKHDRDKLKGFHLINGIWATARIKENMRLGSFLLFDRDLSDNVPTALAELDVARWRLALALLFPGIDTCGCVIMPSTSNRYVIDGIRKETLSCHMLVEVSDLNLISCVWDQACQRSMITKFAPVGGDDEIPIVFPKPVRDKKSGTSKVLRYSCGTIFDTSTSTIGREVFDGAPIARCKGVEILPPEVTLCEGPPLDLGRVKDLTRNEVALIADAIKAITGIRPNITLNRGAGANGKTRVCSLSIVVADLSMDQDVELEDGSWTTVRKLMADGATHVRLQTPFRESVSMAAFFGLHTDGTPFIYDMGTSEKHTLARDGLPAIWQHLSEWLQTAHQPEFVYPDGSSMFSAELGRKISLRDVRPSPEILADLRLASNTPHEKNGEVKENALPTEFNKWLPFAWSDRIRTLTAETESRVNTEAAEQFKAQLARLLTAQVQSDSGDRWLKRALGTWCHYYAQLTPAGEWARVGSYHAWGRLLDDGAFQIGIGVELAAQVSAHNHAGLVELHNNALTKLCRKYGIIAESADNRVWAKRTKMQRPRQIRMTVLSHEFIDSLDLSYEHDDPQTVGLRAGMNGSENLPLRSEKSVLRDEPGSDASDQEGVPLRSKGTTH